MSRFVFADSYHAVNDVFFAVGVGYVSADVTIGKRIIAKEAGGGHIECFFKLKGYIHKSFAGFVLDVPDV